MHRLPRSTRATCLNAVATGVCLLVITSGHARAQSNQNATELRPATTRGKAATVRTQAPIYLTPDPSREPLRIATVGSSLRVVDTQGDWLNVEFQDPQFGRRYGYILARMVSVENPDLKPMDLSVAPDAAQPDRTSARVRLPRAEPDETPQVARRAPMADASITQRARGWITLDLGQFRAREKSVTVTRTFRLYQETAAVSTVYGQLPSDQDLLPAFGAKVWGRLGLNVAVDAQNYAEDVGLGISIPSPYYTNLNAVDGATTSRPLVRKDRAIDIGASASLVDGPHLHLLAFGGPTVFRISNEMISNIYYVQNAYIIPALNVVSITNFEAKTVTATTIGWHVGADIAAFASPHFGVGLTIAYNAGTANLTEPLVGTSSTLKVGHFRTSGGLRMRF